MNTLVRLFILSLAIAQISVAGWHTPNGPFGGQIFSMARAGNSLVATEGNDIFLWNAATGWSSKYHSPLNINFVAEYKGTVYAGANFGIGLLQSNDYGETWARPEGAPNTASASFLGTDSALYLGVFNGIMRTTDNGVNWEQRSTGLIVNAIANIGDTLFIGAFGGLFRSTDGGATSTQVQGGMSSNNVFSLWTDGQSIIAGTDRGAFFSYDRGATWIPSPVPFRSRFVSAIVVRDTVAWASTDIGVFTTGLRTAAWKKVDGLCPGAVFNLIMIEDTMYAACGGPTAGGGEGAGVFSSTDLGATWRSMSEGLIPLSTTAFMPTPGGMLLGTPGAGIFRSTDDGNSWESRPRGLTGARIGGFATAGGTILAALETGIAASTDEGENWTVSASGIPGGLAITAIVVTDTAWFCGVSGKGIYKSVNNGAGWAASNLGLSTSSIQSFYAFDSAIYAATVDRGLYRRKTGEQVWINAASAIPTNAYSVIGSHAGRLFAGTTGLGMYYSDDHAAHWTKVNFGSAPGGTPIYITGFQEVGSSIIVSTSDFGVFTSTDNGATWADANTGLGNKAVGAIAIRNGVLYAGTSAGGVWTRPIGEILAVGDDANNRHPAGFSLAQNYPNPFNPQTTIQYTLGSATNVRLVVYDLLGREAALLVDGVQQPGPHVVTFEASALASGVYYYELRTPTLTIVKPMVVSK